MTDKRITGEIPFKEYSVPFELDPTANPEAIPHCREESGGDCEGRLHIKTELYWLCAGHKTRKAEGTT